MECGDRCLNWAVSDLTRIRSEAELSNADRLMDRQSYMAKSVGAFLQLFIADAPRQSKAGCCAHEL